MGKYAKFIPWAIIIVLGFLLWTNGCERDKTDEGIDVVIPEQSGELTIQPPRYIDRVDTLYVTKWRTKEIYTQNPVNDSLATAYQKALDSIDRYKLYLDAISIRNFENVFEDDYVKITSFGEVTGRLNHIGNRYTIKERTINVDVPETFLRLLAGVEIGQNLKLNDFRYKIGLGLQNQKGSVYRLGYSKENLNDYIFLGYDIQVFDWKR